MKKILFLLIAIFTLNFVNVKADVAAPVVKDKNSFVEVIPDDGTTLTKVEELIKKIEAIPEVKEVKYTLTKDSLYIKVYANNIDELEGVSAQIVDLEGVSTRITNQEEDTCKCTTEPAKCGESTLTEEDTNTIKKVTYILYITEAILVVLIVIIVAMLVTKGKDKKDKKEKK